MYVCILSCLLYNYFSLYHHSIPFHSFFHWYETKNCEKLFYIKNVHNISKSCDIAYILICADYSEKNGISIEAPCISNTYISPHSLLCVLCAIMKLFLVQMNNILRSPLHSISRSCLIFALLMKILCTVHAQTFIYNIMLRACVCVCLFCTVLRQSIVSSSTKTSNNNKKPIRYNFVQSCFWFISCYVFCYTHTLTVFYISTFYILGVWMCTWTGHF